MSAFDSETAAHLERLRAKVSGASSVPDDEAESQADEILEDLDELMATYPPGPTIDDLQGHYGVSAAVARAALAALKTKGLASLEYTAGVGRLARLRAEPRVEPSPVSAVRPFPSQPARAAEPEPADPEPRAPDPIPETRASPRTYRAGSVVARLLGALRARFAGVHSWEAPNVATLAAELGAPPNSLHTAMMTLRDDGVIVCLRKGTARVSAVYQWPGAPMNPADLLDTPRSEAPNAEADPLGPPRSASPKFRAGKRAESKDHSLTRFAHAKVEPERAIGLRADHPALVQERTIFPSTVVSPWDSPALLVSGHNNSKLGGEIQKGPWAGMPQYHLTLEERATCPRSCAVWDRCFGNTMHMARRHDHRDPAFLTLLEAELWMKSREHPQGFVVRLHTLGDFFDMAYVRFWAHAVDTVPGLHVWGFTACLPTAEDPREREIGEAIAILTSAAWDRFAIRFSGHAGGQGSVVLERPFDRDWLIMCPAQTEKTTACATCGLCWNEATRDKTIGFQVHGMKGSADVDR